MKFSAEQHHGSFDVFQGKTLAKLPIEFETSKENEAKDIDNKLRKHKGLEVSVSSVSGLGEIDNNCFQ